MNGLNLESLKNLIILSSAISIPYFPPLKLLNYIVFIEKTKKLTIGK